MAECEGSEGESTPECEGSECEGSEGESTPEYEGSDIGNKDGLIDNEMGLLATEWAYRQRNGHIGDGMGLSATVFVLVWVWNHRERLSASVAGVVANGSTIRFGFGFGPLRMVIGDGLGSYRRWCGKLSAIVWELLVTVNGDLLGFYRRWWSEARRCGLKLDGGVVSEK